uniref:ficolin-1-like n=1 Tax=Styela clava TaxID=7725 RepID=UPI00193ACE25|nr:ficolin-1-like [Styela clava]
MEVYCDLTTHGGGWTVFQRRVDGSLNFNRNWLDYVAGFGNLQHEFWLGLEKLHRLTYEGNFELRIDLEDGEGRKGYASYTIFSIGDASTKYRLNVGGYYGTAGDSLSYHNGLKFSTPDQDNDIHSSNCAAGHRGAWWYHSCHISNLNGEYAAPVGKYITKGNAYGIEWHRWNNAYYYSMKSVEMKFRPAY